MGERSGAMKIMSLSPNRRAFATRGAALKRAAVLSALGLLLMEQAVQAQIAFIPGPPSIVPQSPQIVATADFNRDGIADAAVTDPTSGLVSVLFGAPDGALRSRVSFSVGHELHGIAAGDLNCDGNPDIAVVDSSDDHLFVVTGNCDGTFNQPAAYLTGRGPVDVAIGDFDGQSCADVAVLNQADGTVSIFRNLGRDRGFAVRAFAVPSSLLLRLKVVDLDGNGLDDILAIVQGPEGSGGLAILRNAGDGSFSPPFILGINSGSIDLTVADFNDDGAPDVAILSASNSAPMPYSVSLLLQQVDGAFRVAQGIQLTCPASIRLVPLVCTPTSIAAGDYDGDGYVDVVVSFSTRPVDTTAAQTPGFLAGFSGRGDGTLDFSTQVLVGVDPAGIGTADLTGDGSPDIIVTERGSNSVRIARSVYAPPPPMTGCRLSSQCASGYCVDGVCCGLPACPSGQRCDIPGSFGTCSLPNSNGVRCTDPHQCASRNCLDGSCCASQSCGEGQFCNSGACGPPVDPGLPCTDGSQCSSGACTDGVCCIDTACTAGSFCNVPGYEGQCTALAPNGTGCTDGRQCLSGFCVDQICADPNAPPPKAFIVLGDVTGAPGDRVTVTATLHTAVPIAGTQNDIGFGAGAPIAAAPNGRPDCTANPAINKPATSFAFRPNGCTPGRDCTSIRALVLSTDNVDPIADGALLYTCAARIRDATPPGSYPLAVSGEIASDPDGNQVAFSGADGAVVVTVPAGTTPIPTWTMSPTPTSTPVSAPTRTRVPTNTPGPTVAISVGSATAGPDDTVAVTVTLASGGLPVAGVQADLVVPGGVTIAAKPNGTPDCQVNATINKPASAFSFLPSGCAPGASCTAVRALVLAVDNVDPIPDGAVLYTCRVHVGTTPPGYYGLFLSGVTASDPNGAPLSLVVESGAIVVITPPGATPVPTWTADPAVGDLPTATPRVPGTHQPAGQACDPGEQAGCDSGFCVDTMCCDAATCPAGQRCDIFGLEGTCAPPLPPGNYCQKQTDCAANLICRFDSAAAAFLCLGPAGPTPTLVPFSPVPGDRGHTTNVSAQGGADGGCAMDPAHDGTPALLLALPAGLLLLCRRLGRRRLARRLVIGVLGILVPLQTAAPRAQAAVCVYVTQASADGLSLIDAATNTVSGTIPVGHGVAAVAISPDGRSVYATGYDALSVIDTAPNRVTDVLRLSECGHGVAVTPNGAAAYVMSNRTLAVVDALSHAVVSRILLDDSDNCGCDAAPIAVARDAELAYVAGCQAIVVVDTRRHTVRDRIPLADPLYPGSIIGIAVTPEAALAYVTTFDGVYALQTASHESTRISAPVSPDLYDEYGDIAMAPDGSVAYAVHAYTTADGTLHGSVDVIDVRAGTIAASIPLDDSQPEQVAVSPDGRSVYVTGSDQQAVSVIDATSRTISATIPLLSGGYAIAVGATAGNCTAAPSTPPVLATLSPTPTPTETPTPFPSWTTTPTGCDVETVCIAAGSVSGAPGESVDFDVTLLQDGFDTNVIGNDITTDGSVRIAARADGTPDCAVNSAVRSLVAAFDFLPRGCAPAVDCTGLRAAMESYSEFGEGNVLYRCRVDIASDAPAGSHLVAISNLAAFSAVDYPVCRLIYGGTCDPSSPALPLMGLDGEIVVSGAPGSTPPPTSTPRPTQLPTATATPCDASCPAVIIGSATGVPGQEVMLSVTFRAGETPVSGLQNDIAFDPATPIMACAVNPDIGKDLTGIDIRLDRARALVYGLNIDEPIADGVVLYTCRIAIAPDAAPGSYELLGGNVLGSDASGNRITMAIESGEVVVAAVPTGATPVPTRTPVPTPTPRPTAPAAGPVSVAVGSASGGPGERVQLPVTLSTARNSVRAVEIDIGFDPAVSIMATAAGTPDCAATAGVGRADAVFVFFPHGCTAGRDCTSVRTEIETPINSDLFLPDGVLYSCAVSIGSAVPPGRYAFVLSGTTAAAPSGEPLALVGTDGTLVVTSSGATPRPTWTPTARFIPTPTATPAPLVFIEIETAEGAAGAEVRFAATLGAGSLPAVTIANDISFDLDTPIAATADGTPDCTVNPDLNKSLSRFDFSPPVCPAGEICTRMTAWIFGANLDKIPPGSVLYTCKVNIAAAAPAGSYPLIISAALAQVPDHTDVVTASRGGHIVVVAPAAHAAGTGTSVNGGTGGSGCTMSPPRRDLLPAACSLVLPAILCLGRVVRRRVRMRR